MHCACPKNSARGTGKKKKKKKRQSAKRGLGIQTGTTFVSCRTIMACLVHQLKYTFLVFKQHYMYFHILFHPHIFPKKLKIII